MNNICKPQDASRSQPQQHDPSVSKKVSKKFVKPTTKDLEDYAWSIGYNSFDSGKFMDYYDSKGWIVGKTKMKDWKATVRTWKRNEDENQRKDPKNDYPF